MEDTIKEIKRFLTGILETHKPGQVDYGPRYVAESVLRILESEGGCPCCGGDGTHRSGMLCDAYDGRGDRPSKKDRRRLR